MTSATLKIHITFCVPSNTVLDIAAYGVTRTQEIDTATWNVAASGTPWGAPATNNTNSDRLATPADQPTLKVRDQWHNFDLTLLAPQMQTGVLKRVLLRPEGGDTSGTVLLATSETEQFPVQRPISGLTY